MNLIYICKHHAHYDYQENEIADIAFVTLDIKKARKWCDKFDAVKNGDDVYEWRTYTEFLLDKDLCVPNEEPILEYLFVVEDQRTDYINVQDD